MRVFVLTAEYGSGHIIAARGIEDALRYEGLEFSSLDVVKAGGMLEKLSSWAFEVMMRRGHLAWKLFYYNPIPSSKPVRKIYEFVFKDKFMEPLRNFKPDVIISTHFLTSLISLIYKTKFKIKVYTVVTDFVAHPLWVWEGMDGYFVALEDTAQDLMNYGVEIEKIHVTGIPLRRAFWEGEDKILLRDKLDYPRDSTVILFSAGSYDSVPIEPIIRGLKGMEKIFVVVLAGKRKKAYEKYKEILKDVGLKGVVYPFVDFVPDIMRASDVFVTKAGGVSVAESLAVGLPCIFIRSMPGQEEGNARIIEKYGAGINAHTPSKALQALIELLQNRSRIHIMSENAKKIGRARSSLDIVKIISEEFGERRG